MIQFLLKLLVKFAAALEAAAEKEQKKCEAALAAAAAKVTQANAHRAATRQARQVAAALKDVVAGPAASQAPQQ
ncbi:MULTISPECIES: hypothetical protein [Burkholderia]|uniref:hypothetical protein n=1 Tax=Burkholderia TaxID=32008 RepID=UPI0008413AE4|nr:MULTISPECIES: hypothetical protein [unclassified Burkholderia]AOK28864.1 hypothetical protein AQ611_04905 [Burkholderia sp. Bp7605]